MKGRIARRLAVTLSVAALCGDAVSRSGVCGVLHECCMVRFQQCYRSYRRVLHVLLHTGDDRHHRHD